ncbi:hypothetical protein C0Q70_15457 [Pomacea canaliculata]|uniref:Protein kinase domain-containing protein n=1 Tax=Pomacea canaliculata TaxID=400727 RepID=A0A2T7NUX1_POMCA|nr:hypothetical protein C0Q70_15457 [Pomacea canaliculata]
MDRCTMEYVQSHSASAYIYVIKTDHAGGVQDDQLLEFLRSILSYNKMADGLDVFDPSSAIFVCNRWDQIPKEQKPRVQQNAYQKLKDVWPNFDPKQAFFISATSARMHWDVDHDYITEEYEKLLKGLKDVFMAETSPAHLHQHVGNHDRAVQRVGRCVGGQVHHHRPEAGGSSHQGFGDHRSSETTVEEEALKLCDKFGEILKERETLSKLEKWDPSSIPPMPNFGTGQTEKWVEEIDTIIMRRLVDLVDERMNELKVVENMEMEFKLKAQQHLLLLDEEMDSIVSDMSDRTSLNSSMCSTMTGASSSSDDDLGEELMQLYHRRGGGRFRQLHNFSKMSKASGGARNFRGSMMVLPKIRERRRSSVFSTDPAMYFKSRSAKLTKMVQESKECHQQMVLKYRGRLDTFVSDIDNSVPHTWFVTLYKQIMDDIRVNHRKFQSQKRELLEVMEKLEPIRDQLSGFGALYIRDLTAENIVFSLDVKSRRASIMVSLTEHPMGDSGYDSLPTCPFPQQRILPAAGQCAPDTGGNPSRAGLPAQRRAGPHGAYPGDADGEQGWKTSSVWGLPTSLPPFPPDAEVVSAKPFFCLSPEVLRNEMYSPEDDIYSFGLIVLETCLRVEPYADQRSLKLEEFKNSIHPSSMLALDKLDLRENMSAILRGCLLPARGLRIRMRDLRLHVSKIKDDPEVQLLSCCERRIKHKPITRGRRVSCDESQRQSPDASLIRKYSND